MMPAVWEEFRRLEERMNQLFRELMGGEGERRLFTPFEGVRTPFCDVQETDSEVIITAELPGVSKEDIQINATENEVEIKAEKEDRKYHRVIPLDTEVDPKSARAKYNNGVLEVKLKMKSKPSRGVSVKVE